MNYFGNEKCFELILDLLENAELNDEMTIQVLVNLAALICGPAVAYHKSYMEEFGARIIAATKQRLLGKQDKSIRNIKNEQFEELYKAISGMQLRISEKSIAMQELEIFKLEMCKQYLNSEFLDPRIKGIRNLNQIIANNNTWSTDKQLTHKQIAEWIVENKVLDIIWVSSKTHLQLVERSDKIYKLFLDEDCMSDELLLKLWELSKQSFKAEVYKIINDSTYQLRQQHKQFIYTQIMLTPV